MEKRLVLFLILAAGILFGSNFLFAKLYPQQEQAAKQTIAGQDKAAAPTSSPLPAVTASPAETPAAAVAAPVPPTTTQVELRQFVVKADFWTAKLSNQGGVIVDWTMTHFTNGKPIDPPGGVNLLAESLTSQFGGALRFHIPSDGGLEKELNSARYETAALSGQELILNKGETKEINFTYANNGVEVAKTIIFKGLGAESGSGFDFDFRATVRKNGAPVEAFIVIGPNFGDQKVTKIDTYKHPPQLSYAIDGSVTREPATDLKQASSPSPGPITWAAVDDNYFAMAIMPSRPVPAFRLLNDKYVSMAVALNQGEIQHVYAGPKDLEVLGQISKRFNLEKSGSKLEDMVSYGWLNFIRVVVHPIAQFMLKALRAINGVVHNYGWSIVVLTILLNMCFFPLRWKSSIAMKRAAAMQPKMKDLQDRMKKLEKDDPRMMELQKEQIALMKEGNPLMGCLPLTLQMPFFMAVFAILTVSIEVRHAPFFGWIKDLSAADPFYILPILMCVSMIVQTALTPTTADPVQKKVQYFMPVILTVLFFASSPAGLVLYWMVGNLVGVVQQYVINKLNKQNPPAGADSSDGDKAGKKQLKGKKAVAVANRA
ncbi:MAG: membrane protein insertase YidC [Blastocatellia bacterium]|nr:membrane protein insertase YidC [Blastocatellia bacterium]